MSEVLRTNQKDNQQVRERRVLKETGLKNPRRVLKFSEELFCEMSENVVKRIELEGRRVRNELDGVRRGIEDSD